VPHLGREEAERRHQWYLGPEHLLLGLLVDDDDPAVEGPGAYGVQPEGGNPATRLLHAHGLTLESVRAGIDRLVAEGVLPGPQLSDGELLATLGIDLAAVRERLKESFGWEAYYYAAQWVRLRQVQPFPHAPGAGTPLTCHRVLLRAHDEAVARGQQITPLHLLLGLLRDAERPVDAGLDPGELRLRSMLGLPNSGPSPVRLLVEAHGLTLGDLQAAVRAALDQDG
jgi:Clp amino terminal domain, pathogenicity island component